MELHGQKESFLIEITRFFNVLIQITEYFVSRESQAFDYNFFGISREFSIAGYRFELAVITIHWFEIQ